MDLPVKFTIRLTLFVLGCGPSFSFAQQSAELDQALASFQQGDLGQASQQLEKLALLQEQPEVAVVARFYLAETKWRQGAVEDSLPMIDEVEREVAHSQSPQKYSPEFLDELNDFQLRIARIELNKRHLDSAKLRVEKILKRCDTARTRCTANLLMGAILADQGNNTDASLGFFESVTKSDAATPIERSIALYGQGLGQAAMGRFEQANALIATALADPNCSSMESDFLILSGLVCLEQKRFDDCKAILDRLAKASATNKVADQILALNAKYSIAIGHTKQALEDWQTIVQNYPSSRSVIEARIGLAKNHHDASDDDSAVKLLDDVLNQALSNEQRAQALLQRGTIWLKQSRFDESRQDLSSALTFTNDSQLTQNIRFLLAESLYRLEKWTDANEHWEWLANHSEHDDSTNEWMLVVQIRQAEYFAHQYRWEEAASMARTLSDSNPSGRYACEIDYLLGRCAMAKADMVLARQYFTKVIESPMGKLTELAARAQWMIGESFLLQKNVDAALLAYSSVLSQYDFDEWKAAAITQSGKCYEIRGQLTEAAKLYGQVASQFADTSFAEIARMRLSELKLAKIDERASRK